MGMNPRGVNRYGTKLARNFNGRIIRFGGVGYTFGLLIELGQCV